MNSRHKGLAGEEEAVRFLVHSGYKILARNFRSPRGEIDIVAFTGEQVVFVEVKNWDCYEEESLGYSINRMKQRKIIDTARFFLTKYPELRKNRLRFDIIFFKGGLSKIHHWEEAFGEG